jgi:cytoskeleton protein RodZ
LPSFGEKLKQEREKRKITLEQISVSTKIGTRMLQALEEDKFNQLPGGIFNKGFVRAYSRFVGLDEDQTVADYLLASGDAPPPPTEIAALEEEREPAENIRRMEATSSSASRPLPWGWFAALLLIIALALSVWSRRWREHEKPIAHPNQNTTAAPEPRDTSSAPSAQALNLASGTRSGEVPANGSPNSSAPSTASPPPQTQSATPQDRPVAAGEFVVDVQAHEESWVSYTADGKTHSSELLTAGSERSIPARKEIVLKLGNAGGVDLRFNGKKVNAGGEFGEVKTVTFGPGGVVLSAPTPASTP